MFEKKNMWNQKMPLQINEDILSSWLQPDLYPAQAEVRNLICKVLHKFMGHLRSLSACVMFIIWVKKFNLIWPSDALLQDPHCSTHGHSWKSEGFYLETSFLYNLGFRKEFLWGRVLLFALQLSAEYTWNRTIAASTIAFSFPTTRLKFILVLPWDEQDVKLPVQGSLVTQAVVLPLPVKTHPLHSSSLLNMAVIPIPCARSYFA